MATRYFEDLDVGATFWGDTVTVEREEMLAFAERFDPQPMHLDDAAARAIGLDGVIAPGPFSFALRKHRRGHNRGPVSPAGFTAGCVADSSRRGTAGPSSPRRASGGSDSTFHHQRSSRRH